MLYSGFLQSYSMLCWHLTVTLSLNNRKQEVPEQENSTGKMREARKPEEQIQTVLREGEDNSQKEEQVRAQEDLEGNIPEEEEKPEPAEDFVPNGMILVSGAEAVLDVVQGVSYDVSSGSVTWQTVEFADHYQVDVVDSVTGKEVLSVTSKTGQISLAQHDFITDRGYKIQVTAHSEN